MAGKLKVKKRKSLKNKSVKSAIDPRKFLIMKTRLDPRHQERRTITKELFSYSFSKHQKNSLKTRKIIAKIKEIDKNILRAAPEFPINRLNKVDLAILRLAIFELLIEKKEPPLAIIDEAIEISKEFGSESSPKFINGVLGTIIKDLRIKD